MADRITVDGNEAAASIAHRTSDVIAIYPITPSSSMGELCDEWAAKGKRNLWNTVPRIMEMQSEAGAIGTVHGALTAGALSTTFTSSQGLLLMIPDMYKIAGELTPFTMHVAARTIATHGLSIFGDHSDVMACRQTGFAMLASGTVQEAQDLALVSQVASLRSRIPFLHFFDGFRTSHELAQIHPLSDDDLRALLPMNAVDAHRARGLTPNAPTVRGTAQNQDAYFQAREACSPFYARCITDVSLALEALEARTGRRYRPFEYTGAPDAERLVVVMGSAAVTAHETAAWLNRSGERVGVLQVRLYRPFDVDGFLAAIPASVRSIAVLDRTKEPGAVGEPLYQDVVTALAEVGRSARVIGGRYGLGGKEVTPGMMAGVFAHLAAPTPKRHFTVGIVDDVSGSSIPYDDKLDILADDIQGAVFFGLGSDGTVGANKNSIKIIGEDADIHCQGYFVYDSKKSGAVTISHLRYGTSPIRAPYLVSNANFVACHQFGFLDRYDVLAYARPGATVLLNSPYGPEGTWARLPREVQAELITKKLRLFVIDAQTVAREAGLSGRINTIMQTCWFAISGVMPRDAAIAKIKHAIDKTYARRGPDVLAQNHRAVDGTLANLHAVALPATVGTERSRPPAVSTQAPDFVQRITAMMLANRGDLLPVSAFPVDGTWPTGTAQWEKRNLAQEIPIWDASICIQCNKCAMVCPHAAIRVKAFPESAATPDLPSVVYKGKELPDHRYSVQVAPEDCTGCGVCVAVCPAKDRSNPRHKSIDMLLQAPVQDRERRQYEAFLAAPDLDPATVKLDLRTAQLMRPLFEYSGACAGCGETPYIKLLTQLVGDHLLIANATGCSSIYGGNLPTTPYTTNAEGRGPAWANSLFEDNAEFGLGFRLAIDQKRDIALALVQTLAPALQPTLVSALLADEGRDAASIAEQRLRVIALRSALQSIEQPAARLLDALADSLVYTSVWLVGGDGWAYDIGYGGLDHVLASGQNINVLVLDTEVYSNTGGQASKATPRGASAKFATAGKNVGKKDLGLMAMAYGHVYVARVAFGAKDAQTVKALQEAESYPGASLVIAYSHCIAHGYDLVHGLEQQKSAVETGYWPLFRFDPRLETPLQLDSAEPKGDLGRFMRAETRFRATEAQDPDRFAETLKTAQAELRARFALYASMAKRNT
ncbi:pyruvate-flavodoxin oxidoreductase [Deltaproteobacteria bacterium]|nr:pyruvate-flavodoxin oxidoreductase [Deltaproteobacteria bacterium]